MCRQIFSKPSKQSRLFLYFFSVLPGVCWLIFWVLTNGFDVISASSDLHSSEDTEFDETSILKRYSHENRWCRPLGHSTSYIASRFLKYFFCLWKQKSSTFRNDHFDKLDHTGHYYVELSRFTNNFAYICSPICTKFTLNWPLLHHSR